MLKRLKIARPEGSLDLGFWGWWEPGTFLHIVTEGHEASDRSLMLSFVAAVDKALGGGGRMSNWMSLSRGSDPGALTIHRFGSASAVTGGLEAWAALECASDVEVPTLVFSTVKQAYDALGERCPSVTQGFARGGWMQYPVTPDEKFVFQFGKTL